MNIVVCGSTGRMGNAVIEMLGSKYQQHTISGQINSKTTKQELDTIISVTDIIIDFSLPALTETLLEVALANKTPLVLCVTGLSDSQLQKVVAAGDAIPILHAPNTSLGANLLATISGKIASILQEYDAEIIDTHHRHKKDAPSGTAIAIAKSIADARGDDYAEKAVIGRAGVSLRRPGEIGISSLRSGGVYGSHDVSFASEHEIVTISHQALSRNVFAEGAIEAAIWLAQQPVGFYRMHDMLSF